MTMLMTAPKMWMKNVWTSIPDLMSSLSSFSSVSEDKVWCPVRALRWYLDKVRSNRTSPSLFVTHIEPFSSAFRSTFARWIVECIKFAGAVALLSDHVRAHDTRSVSSSWALFLLRLSVRHTDSRLLVDAEHLH